MRNRSYPLAVLTEACSLSMIQTTCAAILAMPQHMRERWIERLCAITL